MIQNKPSNHLSYYMSFQGQNNNLVRFTTFSCYRRLPFLRDDRACIQFLQVLSELRQTNSFKLYGYVLMPEHVHLVLHPQEGEKAGLLIGQLKGVTSRRFFQLHHGNDKHVFWNKRCYDNSCRTTEDVKQKIEYCHNNPVKRGLITQPNEWKWSSFNWYNGKRNELIEMDEIGV